MHIWDIDPTDQTVIDPAGRECPLDPMTGEPKVPGNAVTEAPPATGEHEAAQAVDGAWQVVPDWRGHVYWTAEGERHEITELGVEPPADALSEAPPEPIADLAERKRNAMDTARDAAFAAGLPYDIAGTPDVVQTRPQDQINLLGLFSKAERLIDAGDTTTLMPFRGLSNVTHHLTPGQMATLALEALEYIEGVYQRSWDRKDTIAAALDAGDRAAIEAVEW